MEITELENRCHIYLLVLENEYTFIRFCPTHSILLNFTHKKGLIMFASKELHF